jgi:hypothetical protein
MSVTYFLITYMYVKVCTADVLSTDGHIHFMKCTNIIEQCMYTAVSFWSSFLICPAGSAWLACRQGLAAARCHLFKFKHTSLIGINLSHLLLSTPGAGAGAPGASPWSAVPAAPALAWQWRQLCRHRRQLCQSRRLRQLRPRPRCLHGTLGPIIGAWQSWSCGNCCLPEPP